VGFFAARRDLRHEEQVRNAIVLRSWGAFRGIYRKQSFVASKWAESETGPNYPFALNCNPRP
jgi:hypothetical protein